MNHSSLSNAASEQGHVPKDDTLGAKPMKRASSTSHRISQDASFLQDVTLEKRFTFWPLLGYQLSVMASWSNYLVIAGTFVYVGGPVALIYGALIVGIFQITTALCLSELASIWPHAGGSQYWITQMTDRSSGALFSYLTGWMNILAYLTGTAASNFAAAQTLTALVTLLNGYEWPRYQVVLLYWAICLLDIPINILPKYYPAFNIASLVWLMVSLFLTVGIWASDFHPQSADFVFKTFINETGWSSNAMVFLLSLTQSTFAATGLDAVVHLSEETKNPKKTIPLVLSFSVAMSTAMSFGFGVFLLYSMGRFDKLVNTTLGAVYLQLYVNAIGLKAGLAVATTIMVLLAIFVASQVMTASSRLIWAMARQQGVPFSAYFAHVEPNIDVPLRALVASFVATLLLGLLYLAGDLAWNAIASSVTISYQLVFIAPIVVLLCRGRSILPDRYFDIGKVSWIGYSLNIIAVAWGIFISVISLFPIYLPVTGDTMNYSIIVFGIWGLVVGVYWVVSGSGQFIFDVIDATAV
ncbi:hypothetical protein FALCPG4_018481 [Fusarium falciforme]